MGYFINKELRRQSKRILPKAWGVRHAYALVRDRRQLIHKGGKP